MISLIIYIAILGLIVWLVTAYIPMPEGFKRAIYIIAVICVIFILLDAVGLLPLRVYDPPVPQLR